MMKRIGLAVLAVTAFASIATAGQIKTLNTWGPYQSGSGGEFRLQTVSGFPSTAGYVDTVTKNVGNVANTFQAFCLEVSEHIALNQTYYAELDTAAIKGGTTPTTGFDTLSKGTGWLYSQFARGTLAGYTFGGTDAQRKADAALLQNAIWCLEDEGSCAAPGANKFLDLAMSQFGGLGTSPTTGARADGANLYGVYALNLWTSSAKTGFVQSQVFYVPDGGATLSLLGAALLGLGALRRKLS